MRHAFRVWKSGLRTVGLGFRAFIPIVLLCLGVAGCSSSKGGGRGSGADSAPVPARPSARSSGGIEEVHLFGIPVAMNFDRTVGPDGFVVRVFASSHARAKGLPVRSGLIEILMYDGTFREGTQVAPKPTKVWSFPAAKLDGYATESSLGLGYQFALKWETSKPTQNRITVVARYVPPTGPPIYSVPSVIPVPSK